MSKIITPIMVYKENWKYSSTTISFSGCVTFLDRNDLRALLQKKIVRRVVVLDLEISDGGQPSKGETNNVIINKIVPVFPVPSKSTSLICGIDMYLTK